MKRMIKNFSGTDMLEAFKAKLAELESSPVTSTTWIDPHSLFGEPNGRYTDEDLREYWDKEHDNDYTLMSYDNYEDWYNETTANMTPVEGCNSSAVTAAEALDTLGDTSKVYMLMYYHGGTEGMESDEFACECMFKAADLDDARAQVADWEGTRVRYYDENEEEYNPFEHSSGQYYADYFNDYFIGDTDEQVYDSVAEWAATQSDVPQFYAQDDTLACDGIKVNSEDSDKESVYGEEPIEASLGRGMDDYFGQTAAKMYGESIINALQGKTISKRRDLANEPGGLIYEAEQLGLEWDRLLEALEGMCAEGRAREIDDSTYLIVGGQGHPVRGLFSATAVDNDELFNIAERYNTSNPVSGDWTTEIEHEQNAIAEHFGISLDEAKQVMIDQLGFDESDFAPYYLRDTDRWISEMEQYAEENPSDNGWEQIATKQVEDSDGFMTEYTMYHNTLDDSYVCVFGDRDLYRPEMGEFDWEGESEEEAWEWFNCYNGFGEDIECAVTCGTNPSDRPYSNPAADFLADHQQAYDDACVRFDVYDLEDVDLSALEEWISEHDQLNEDYLAWLNR